ncbi:MAG: ABC transporter ATP-binding protein [Gemmatimonadota bacterium]
MTTLSPNDRPLVLQVRDLVVRFDAEQGTVHAVNGVSYSIAAGEALALVGESGSGKTVSALALMGLVPTPPGRVERGRVLLRERDLLTLTPREWQQVRGREIAMVFQDPMSSLNPVLTIGRQMTEALEAHLHLGRQAARARAVELLERVGIAGAAQRLSDHPHEFSGGQRQRIGIAMALSCDPVLLIADEPTTALDVTIQAQIVELVQRLQDELGTAILWITHDLALVAGFADVVAVMYAGTLVEQAPAARLYTSPRHPYTVGLLRSLPRIDAPPERRLPSIEGAPPDLTELSPGCPFAPRCSLAVERCRAEHPPLQTVAENHTAACWRWEEVGA